ncbi:hypothetical protein BGZ65_006307 [Modicella reniformis]|uniref:Uncharacterized protein n=1 Tax=Modicella reniformis TaxID=1440133 RepID=A0A9P6MBE3_9FUNG|nr:hypothetical protein BGZ65_006307 [Modicella reniformis]
MLGHFLLSLLVIAAVAVQLCAANMVPNGVYILNFGGDEEGFLGVEKQEPGTEVLITDDYRSRYQQWEIKGHGRDTVTIRSRGSNFYLAPKNPSEEFDDDPVTLSDQKFEWHLFVRSNAVLIARSDSPFLFLSRSTRIMYPSHAAVRSLRPGNPLWEFRRVHGFQQETRMQCGSPWRIPRDSLYIQ